MLMDLNGEHKAKMLVCWAPEAAGFSGLLIRLAKHFEIPVLNMAEQSHRNKVNGLLAATAI